MIGYNIYLIHLKYWSNFGCFIHFSLMTQIDCVVHFYMDFYSTNSTFFLVFLDHILPSTFSPGYNYCSYFDLLIYAQKKTLENPHQHFCQKHQLPSTLLYLTHTHHQSNQKWSVWSQNHCCRFRNQHTILQGFTMK